MPQQHGLETGLLPDDRDVLLRGELARRFGPCRREHRLIFIEQYEARRRCDARAGFLLNQAHSHFDAG